MSHKCLLSDLYNPIKPHFSINLAELLKKNIEPLYNLWANK